ncbi:hypothetical protein CU048_06465 [Beijerinckiaceae bacterium]|nr:hypothetical protein CU048_06465 [Beijerinckiaceae bacterium]
MATQIFVEETEVVPLLTKMRLPRWVILELASKVAGERANVTDEEPTPVRGYETWRWGTRYAREDKALKSLEWELCDKHQVSGIRNEALGIKLVFCNTDSNTGNIAKAPKNLSEKGPSSCRLIGYNGRQLVMNFIEKEELDDLWYFCVAFSKESILIEISRPDSESAGVITNFSHRIIVARPGEIPGIRKIIVPQDFADVPKPPVTRKLG